MAISVINWVWDHSRSRNGARLVLLAIADSASSDGDNAWPSIAELMRKSGLGERAVQSAIGQLAQIGELEVAYNAGPKGCNRYRVIMGSGQAAPAESAPPQDPHPARSAPPQKLRGPASAQARSRNPARSAPPAESAPPQDLRHPPAESAPGTVLEPSFNNSPSESSTTVRDSALLAEPVPIHRASRGQRRSGSADPLFDAWYAAYPVHKSRGAAEKAWTTAMREGADPQALLTAAAAYRTDPQVLRGYGKHPATWLNGKCWLDEATPAARSGSYAPYQNPTDQSVYSRGFV